MKVGDKVILGRHEVVNGTDNWVEDMNQYVGNVTTILTEPWDNGDGCPVVGVEGNIWSWRVENMELINEN